MFFPKYGTAGFPFAKRPFFEVSKPQKAYSSFQLNGRLTVREMTIFRRFGK